MTDTIRDAIVLGGGAAGLMAARTLRRAGRDVVTLEAAPRVGGVVETVRRGDWLFELGPNTVLDRGPLPDLVRELGLEDEVEKVPLRGRSRFVYRRGRLQQVPRTARTFLTSRLFSWRGKLALIREPWRRGRSGGQEETIAELVRRRLSSEWLETLVGPFVSGIYAGDPERLSARWTLGHLVALEARHGSVIRGFLRTRSSVPGPRAMIAFPGGLTRLVGELAAAAGEIRTGCRATAVSRADGAFLVATDQGTVRGRGVIVALPAVEAAAVLSKLTSGESDPLARMAYAPLAVVGFGFAPGALENPPLGTGFLVPRDEDLRILGCLCPSNLFAGRAPAGGTNLTLFLGGALDPEAVRWEEDRLYRTALADLDRVLGLREEPAVRVARRWPRAIPQYPVGHGRLIEAVEGWAVRHPGLAVAGSFLRGVALPDALESGRAAAQRLLDGPDIEVIRGAPVARTRMY